MPGLVAGVTDEFTATTVSVGAGAGTVFVTVASEAVENGTGAGGDPAETVLGLVVVGRTATTSRLG